MRIALASCMRAIDKFCIEELKIPGIVLMENAAIKVAKNVEDKYKKITIVCGTGNNGGDGFAVARHLYKMGLKLEVFLVGNEQKMSQDCAVNYDILKNMNINIVNIYDSAGLSCLESSIEKSEVVIDSIFGTGLNRNVEGIFNSIISVINEKAKYILSIDVPSGMNSDSGSIMGNCIKADKTVSFEAYKNGFLQYENDKYTGEIVIENIGIPEYVIDRFCNNSFLLDENMIKESIIKRNKYSHKGDFGRTLIFAGSKGYSGASYIATEAAVKTGAGLVTLCTYKEIQNILCEKLIEAMTVSFDEEEKVNEMIKKSDAIAIGSGMGNSKYTLDILKKVISNAKCPIVIDADGINVLSGNLSILENKNSEIILTPHLGEMSRITGINIESIKKDRRVITEEFALKYNVTVLLKGFNTIITDGKTTVINSTGSSAMASGGMGDCLTGIITSLIGQGYPPFKAAYIGAYLHGYCGDILAKDKFSVTASDVIEEIPYAMKKLGN